MLLSECLDAFEPNQRMRSRTLRLLTKKMTMVGHSGLSGRSSVNAKAMGNLNDDGANDGDGRTI